MSTFDFDELDAAESAPPGPAAGPAAGHPAAGPAAGPAEGVEEGEIRKLVRGLDAAAEVSEALSRQTGGHPAPGGGKPISRARAWFEIRRFFEAEPQRHYGGSDRDAWRTYFAKELILKAACERLQSDGFVVIDALLAPDHFANLAVSLLAALPEEASSLRDHVPGVAARPGQLGWVGAEEQLRREQVLRERALRAAAALEAPSDPADPAASDGAGALARLAEDGAGALARLAPHDRALCESCSVLLASDRSGCSAVRPRSMQQFFAVMKSFMQIVAENSMSRSQTRHEDKIHVQLSFGNAPPRQALEAVAVQRPIGDT